MINPYQIEEHRSLYEGMSEHEHQRELFSWSACATLYGLDVADSWALIHPRSTKRHKAYLQDKDPSKGDQRLEWLMAIPNGGARSSDSTKGKIRAGRMKAEGLRKGVADVFLSCPSWGEYGRLHGLWVEMKRPGGRLSEEQKGFLLDMKRRGYGAEVAYGYWEAVRAIRSYLEPIRLDD